MSSYSDCRGERYPVVDLADGTTRVSLPPSLRRRWSRERSRYLASLPGDRRMRLSNISARGVGRSGGLACVAYSSLSCANIKHASALFTSRKTRIKHLIYSSCTRSERQSTKIATPLERGTRSRSLCFVQKSGQEGAPARAAVVPSPTSKCPEGKTKPATQLEAGRFACGTCTGNAGVRRKGVTCIFVSKDVLEVSTPAAVSLPPEGGFLSIILDRAP